MYQFVSYNVLAKELESQLTPSPHTSFEVRLPKILNRVESFLRQQAILALQEVDETLYKFLQEIFILNNYGVYYVSYGKHGALLAYPSQMRMEGRGNENIGEAIGQKTQHLNKSLSYTMWNSTSKRTALDMAINQKKKLLWIQLRDGDNTFFVFTYHFPVSFFWIPVSGAHLSMVLERIHTLSDDNPFVLLTDFNSTENSALYKYICGKKIKRGLSPHPHWEFYRHHGLVDARCLLDHKGPTVKSKQKGAKVFEGCLDYIFLSKQWKPISFEQKGMLPRKAVKGTTSSLEILPSEEEGSDHIPISCVVLLE